MFRFLHFRRLTATGKGSTSLYPMQAVEKRGLSTACYVNAHGEDTVNHDYVDYVRKV